MNPMHTSILLLALLLAGCGGGDINGRCTSLSGGNAQLQSSCTGCTLSDTGRAVDGNLGSAATAVSNAGISNPVVTIRATAQNGTVFPAGSLAGVFYSQGDVQGCSNCGITVNTYLRGARQQTQSGVNNSDIEGSGPEFFTGITATLPFDAVEISDAATVAPTGGTALLRTYEICSNAEVD